MSRDDGILVAVVSTRPWQMFDAGIKGAEYRADAEGKDGWARKLISAPTLASIAREGLKPDEVFHNLHDMGPEWFHDYHTLRLPLGYAHDRPVLEMPIRFIDWGLPNPEWTCGIIAPRRCFRIWGDLTRRKRIA